MFVHSEELGGQPNLLRVGTRVEYQVMISQRGLKAYDVKIRPDVAGPDQRSSRELDDDELYEVISTRRYGSEVTDALIANCPEITAAQIVAIRNRLVELAEARGWLEG